MATGRGGFSLPCVTTFWVGEVSTSHVMWMNKFAPTPKFIDFLGD